MVTGKSSYLLSLVIAGIFLCGCGQEEAPLTREQAWGLAAAALLAERNFESHDLLGGYVLTDRNEEAWRAGLVKGWDIGSRDDLLNMLQLIDQDGDRKKFDEEGAHVASLSKRKYGKLLKKSRDDIEQYHRLQLVRKEYGILGEKSLTGWDYCRYISLCRWGYLAGYFTEEEAWERIMYAARKLQATFDSWEELGRNYLIGREFWSYEDTQKNGPLYHAAYRRLLDNPRSPWNQYSWDMDLDEAQN